MRERAIDALSLPLVHASAGASVAERILLFYRLWIQKEALIKATGKGFACPPRGFAVPDVLREGARSAPFTFPGETATWLVTDLRAPMPPRSPPRAAIRPPGQSIHQASCVSVPFRTRLCAL